MAGRPISRRTLIATGAGTLIGTGGRLAVAQEGGEAGETVECRLVDFAFEPGTDQPLVIPPGTTVVFVWETDNHNVVVDEQPAEANWEGHESIENAPFEFESTFDVEGTYEFHCEPHLGLGMVGTIEVEAGVDPGGGAGEIQELVPETAETLAIATTTALVTILSLTYVVLKYAGTGPPRQPE